MAINSIISVGLSALRSQWFNSARVLMLGRMAALLLLGLCIDPKSQPARSENLLEIFAASTFASARLNLSVTSPEIRAINSAIADRAEELNPFFDVGAIGLIQTGYLEIRDQTIVPLADRVRMRRLIAEDNRDREHLFHEIANKNDLPQSATDVGRAFFTSWLRDPRNMGRYYKDDSDSWQQKN